MSKGWESKNVEEQQAQASGSQTLPPEDNAAARAAEAERKRRVQALELQRERILSERTSSPHRRSALATALESIEYELEKLGSLIKL
jgi:hypothetical protein